MSNQNNQIPGNQLPAAVGQAVEETAKEPQAPRISPYKDFEKDFLQLSFDEPFLSSISMHIIKQEDWTKPTAYVGVEDLSVTKANSSYRLVMGYNPEFMAKYSSRQRQGVIMHELFHVAMKHLTERNVLIRITCICTTLPQTWQSIH